MHDSEASLSALHDVLDSAASEPNSTPPTSMPMVDETISNQQPVDMDATVSAAVYSSADTVVQSPSAEKDTVQSTDSPKSEPAFASANTKPKPEVKSDLSSMFKSLSAKMMMKRVRQSRFSDISPAVSISSESSGAAAVTENSYVPTDIESSHLLHRSVDIGAPTINTDTVRSTDNGSLLPPFSRAVKNVPLAVSSQNSASMLGLQNDDVQNKTGGSLPLSCMPICPPPLPPGIITSLQNNGIMAVTHSVSGVIPSLPGL